MRRWSLATNERSQAFSWTSALSGHHMMSIVSEHISYFNNTVYFIPWFRLHLKHCSSDHNTNCDLEFDKNVPRLVTTGAVNLKKKQSEGNTVVCYEYPFYINTKRKCGDSTQVQMLKGFNRLLIQKFTVSAQGTSCQNFFPAHCRCVNFFWDDGVMQDFFSYAYSLAGYFFSKSPTPSPLKVKWLAPNIK